jgi:hypothetical protein
LGELMNFDIQTRAMRALVYSILLKPSQHAWTVQGVGMLRTYIGRGKEHRLNVWHSALAVPNVSLIHDHPWHFASWILNGTMLNVRFIEHPERYGDGFPVGDLFEFMRIKCGPGGGPAGESGVTRLQAVESEQYRAGGFYAQQSHEIHMTAFDDGTVTLNERVMLDDCDHARVFWAAGKQWVDAEPRVATQQEIQMATRAALGSWA